MNVSIIIPVFNGQKFITNCIQYLLRQTYQNWQALFINDGSTDNTLETLKQFANQDNRIKIITQKNQGAAKARETGIKAAQSDFITFLDVDDTLSNSFLEKSIAQFTPETDIVVSTFNIIQENQTIRKNIKPGYFDKKEYLKKVLTGHYGWELCAKMYRRSLFEQPLNTPANIRIGEDAAIFIQLILRSRRINVLNEPLYNYIQYNSSASHVQSKEYAEETLKAGFFIKSILEQDEIYNTINSEAQAMLLLFFSNSTRKAYLGNKHPLVQRVHNEAYSFKSLNLLPLKKSIYITFYFLFGKHINKIIH